MNQVLEAYQKARDTVGRALRYKWSLLFILLLGVLSTEFYVKKLPDIYKAEARLAVELSPFDPIRRRAEYTVREKDALRLSFESVVYNRAVLGNLLEELGLYAALRQQQPMSVVLEQAKSDLAVEATGERGLRVSYVSESSEKAEKLVNGLVGAFLAAESRRAQEALAAAESLGRERLQAAEQELGLAEKALRDFVTENAGLMPALLGRSESFVFGPLGSLGLAELLQYREELRRTVRDVKSNRSLAPDTLELRLREELATKRRERAALGLQLTDEHPQQQQQEERVKQLEGELDALGPAWTESEREAFARALAREQKSVDLELARRSKGRKTRVNLEEAAALAEASLAYSSLLRQEERARSRRDELRRLREEAKTAAELEASVSARRYQVVDAAEQAMSPIAPRRGRLRLFGWLASLAALGIAAFLRVSLETRLQTEEDIVRLVDSPILARIPRRAP